MLPLPLRKKPALGVVVGLWIAVGCVTRGSEDKGSSEPPPFGPDASGVVIQDGQVLDAKSDTSSTLLPTINPLCGTVNFDCGQDPVTKLDNTPDDVTACENFDGGSSGGAGGTSSVLGGAGGVLDGGSGFAFDASTATGSGGLGSATDAAAAVKSPDGGPFLYAALTYPTAVGAFDAGPAYACQVVPADNGLPIRRCVKAGTGGTGAPCSASGDCQAGLACVGIQGAGQCRPYCCESTTQCVSSDQPDGHTVVYCGERPLLDGTANTGSLMVPVCVPADGCLLDQPYPCTTSNCTCPTGTACTVVGDGATSCVVPGTGKLGDPCPYPSACAWGYYCSQSTQTCVKICKTSTMDTTCSPGVCQATAGFPDGFGLCVGLSPTLQ